MMRILELLRQHHHQWLSMDALRTAAGASPAEVHRRIEQLRTKGYLIEVNPAQGYRLVASPESLTAELIEYGLGVRHIGKKVLVYDETDSTNDVAWEYAREPDGDGLAVFAERQRAGRGRLGRHWAAAKTTSVLCSVLISEPNLKTVHSNASIPKTTREKTPAADNSSTLSAGLSLMGGLAAAEAIENVARIPTRIKWPNDVLINNRKAAGVMVESKQVNARRFYVIGIGVNCNQQSADFPTELADRAISIRQMTGTPIDRVRLAQELISRLDYWYDQLIAGQYDPLHDAWLSRCGDIGSRLTLVCDARRFTGRVIDVMVRQGLLMQLDDGGVRVFDGSITTRALD